MSISLVYSSSIPDNEFGEENLESLFGDAQTISSIYGYIKEFHAIHPNIKFWSNNITEFDCTTYIDLEFPDQYTLDLYLNDDRNLQTIANNLMGDSDLIEFKRLNPTITQTIQILENTDKVGRILLNIPELIIPTYS